MMTKPRLSSTSKKSAKSNGIGGPVTKWGKCSSVGKKAAAVQQGPGSPKQRFCRALQAAALEWVLVLTGRVTDAKGVCFCPTLRVCTNCSFFSSQEGGPGLGKG